MIRKIAKCALSFVMILYFVFLSLFGLGDYLYPDTASLYTGDAVSGVLCFSYEEEGQVPASQNALCTRQNTGQILAFGVIPIKDIRVQYFEKTSLLCGGDLFGLRVNTRGLLVTGMEEVKAKSGALCPGKEAGVKKGDLLLRADGVDLESAASFSKLLAKSEGRGITLSVRRGEEDLTFTLNPAFDEEKSAYRAGLWVRDGAAGIGTVTFRDPVTGAFAGLGHAVCDTETGVAFPLASGSVCPVQIEDVCKGDSGSPGEIRGKLMKDVTGSLAANENTGVYGTFLSPGASSGQLLPIGLKSSVSVGKASIFCTVGEEGKQEYEIEIEEIIGKDRESKNFVLHVTDPRLIEKTGGIVQGMSGSPIVQNGHLIGAVTHVLVGDPTRGYGIFIENMLSNMPS